MKSAVFAILFVFAVLCEYALTYPVKYDQRQEGDLNVRTDVEDVLFVVVPPQDLVAAGMGLVAATAADFLRKNYGAVGPERWPVRTVPKLGFVPLEKSPYKIDLEKSGVKVKKISQVGDPNRYNFHDNKNPSKAEIKLPMSTEVPEKLIAEIMTEMAEEMLQSTTESKTVKKVLKPEEIKKIAQMTDGGKKEMQMVEGGKKDLQMIEGAKKEMPMIEEGKKDMQMAEGAKKEMQMAGGEKKITEQKKTMEERKQEKISSENAKKSERKTKTEEMISEEPPKVIGEEADVNSNPFSIFRLEGCGPDAKRDSSGKCVIQTTQNSQK